MQIKSWHISLVGNIPIIGFFLWLILQDIGNRSNIPIGGISLFIIFIYFMILLLPVLLLKSKNETVNKIGGFVSLLYGVLAGILFIMSFAIFFDNFNVLVESFYGLNTETFVFGIILFFSMLAFFLAGIYYFWKKI